MTSEHGNDVGVQGEVTLAELAAAAAETQAAEARLAELRIRRDALVHGALALGFSFRRVAQAAGISHVAVQKIAAKLAAGVSTPSTPANPSTKEPA